MRIGFHFQKETSMIWPNFFIVGAAKAGTTSLYYYLKQHPQVFMSPLKEPHFFSIKKPIADEKTYLSLFRKARGYIAIGEASPSYLWHPEAPYRIREKIPEAKIIISLRDPIDRAYSHYLMDVRDGRQKLPFYQALIEDYQRPNKGWGISHLYVELGLYYQQLKRYIETFGRDQVLIIMFEDLKTAPQETLRKIAEFLCIDPKPMMHVDVKVYNQYAKPRFPMLMRSNVISFLSLFYRMLVPKKIRQSVREWILLKKAQKPSLDDRAREFLRNIYAPDLRSCEKFLRKDLSVLRKVW